MAPDRDNLIAGLTEDLAPVRQFNARDGAILVGLAVLATVIGVELVEGLWRGILTGEAAPFFWVTNGLLLVLGLASSGAVIAMGSPSVGSRHDAPKWASAMLAVLPITAALSVMPHANGGLGLLADPFWYHCSSSSLVASLATGVALILWLRRGAPVSLATAGWFTGVGAGALGSLAYGLSCGIDTVTHLGIWHVFPVVISAIVGRIVVPILVKW